jgi:hypothetical protein
MMIHFIKTIGFFIVLFTTVLFYGQRDYGRIPNLPKDSLETKEDNDSYRPFNFNLTVKNMHLWRGYRVTDEAMTAANVYYESKNGKFKAGLWGGVGFAGNYTEFDYYLSYEHNNWTFAVWDINNYTDFPNAKIFNYDRAETSHFIDVSITHRLEQTPLQFSWSTIVQGRDTYINSNGDLRNAFTNYVEASYSIADGKNWNLSAYVGAAFSFVSDANFYGDETGFNNFGLSYTKDLKILDKYTIPLAATVMWNNLQDYGALQIAVDLF